MKTVYIKGQQVQLKQIIGEGQEAVVYRLNPTLVVKIYRQPNDPQYQGNLQEQQGAKDRLRIIQQKLRNFPKNITPHVIGPVELAYNKNQEVIGYKIFLNWAKFTEHNNKIDKGRFYDRDGNPTLKYSESPYYPKNHITDFYIDDNEAQSHMVLVYPEDIKAFENVPKPQASKEDLLALLKEHLKLNVKVKGDREGGYQTVSVDITVLFAGETICGSRDYTSFCVNNN